MSFLHAFLLGFAVSAAVCLVATALVLVSTAVVVALEVYRDRAWAREARVFAEWDRDLP